MLDQVMEIYEELKEEYKIKVVYISNLKYYQLIVKNL